MTQADRFYIAIDLKSFYASVECMERGLDPLTTNLVVADKSRTNKTICLAVSPSLKACGIPGRPRLFEVVQRVAEINLQRKRSAPARRFAGASCDERELVAHPEYALDYLVATPRMAHYIDYSARIYQIYLHFVAPEDIHVYSIDEVFMDVTAYLRTYRTTAQELARRIVLRVFSETGVTATAGVGTNLYLAKIAMDIGAKHIPPDANGVRIAALDEMRYRERLWSHRPLTDFWRIGRRYAKRLEALGLYTMGDIARCSVGRRDDFHNEELLYQEFGVNAELIIDHAWGWEPCTIADIKAYRPETNSLSSGQVLHRPYPYEKAKLIVREMADLLALDLVEKRLVADQLSLTIGYDVENLSDPDIRSRYRGPVTTDYYGRRIPKHAHGSAPLPGPTSSTRRIVSAAVALFERIVDPLLLVRRIVIAVNHVTEEAAAVREETCEQLDLFTNRAEEEQRHAAEAAALAREKRLQEAVIDIRKKYGKNAVLKGMNLLDDATARERNSQIGGHKA